jgi:uncharacterized repeat protein (TIGR01451 family)/LPXTG-motif cell wall-anchored protein
MKIARLFNSLPKKLAAAGFVALAFALPAATTAASLVKIEADTTVANANTGSGWHTSASASYNQVVDVQVVYNNDEAAGSGKTANNLRVKINIPTTAGANQVVTTKTSADNSNAVSGSAKVTLDRADAYLQYIPGTATWKHAASANAAMTVTQKVSDDVVTNPNGLRLENENPCQAGSIQVQARVMVPGLTIDKQVRPKGTHTWATSTTAKPGDTVQYMISYKNTGNTDQKKVVIGDKLPAGITYVPGTTYLANDSAPNGKLVTDGVTTSGIIIGDYAPGVNAFVMFDAKLPAEDKLACGTNTLRNIASVQPQGMNYYYNTADVVVTKTNCTTTTPPSYSCDLLTLAKHDNRMANATVTHSQANGATFKSTSINWGDGTTNGEASHTYAKDGTYHVVATVSFTVNGQTKTDTNAKCESDVNFTTTETKQPEFSCDLLSVSQKDDRSVTASVAYTAQNGATFKTVTLDWGDSSTPLTTSNTTANYQYAQDGTYTITAKILFSVNGKDTFAPESDKCVKQVSFSTPTPPTTPPNELPNTGAGNIIGIFVGAVVAGTIGYRLFLSRKLAR